MTEVQQSGWCVAPGRAHAPQPGTFLCSAHFGTLLQQLSDVEQLYATLDASLSMQAADGTRGSGLASHRAPARIDVLVLRDPRSRDRSCDDPDGNTGRGVLEILHSWARVVREERDLSAPAPVTVSSERGLLVAHLPWIASQPWVDEFLGDVKAAWGLLRAAHGHERPRPVGKCPAASEGVECGGLLWADTAGGVDCWDCGHSYTPDQLRALGEVLMVEGYVDTYRAEWLTGVTAVTIRKWVSLGRIDSRKEQPTGAGRPKLLVQVKEVERVRDSLRRVVA